MTILVPLWTVKKKETNELKKEIRYTSAVYFIRAEEIKISET